MPTLTLERSSASGLNRMSAFQRSKRPSIATPPQAVAKPRVDPASTFQAGAAASVGVSAAGAVSTTAGAAACGASIGASATTCGGGGRGLLAGGAGRTA